MLAVLHGRIWLLTVLTCVPLLCMPSFAIADARMHVDVLAEKHGIEVGWLHAHIKKAADMALPALWYRLVPQEAHGLIPKKVKAIRFLQKATPTADGVSITFHKKRVLKFLHNNSIPYYEAQSVRMPELQPVARIEPDRIDPNQTEPDRIASDRIESDPTGPDRNMPKPAPLHQLFSLSPVGQLLTIQRQASLPEQVLFEDDLARDPRIASLKLRQVTREFQQYRLHLKGADERWLSEWFRHRGLTLSPSVEGWVAH